MYKNYGDVNFFEYGVIVEIESENVYHVIKCTPDCNEENIYLLQDDIIDITDSWIDKHEVCSYIGLRDFSIDYTDDEKLQFAIGVLVYYREQSSCGGQWMTKNDIIDYINNRCDIDADDYGFYSNNFDEDNRNVVVEICSHTGARFTIVKNSMEEIIEYFTDYVEVGDSITIVSK